MDRQIQVQAPIRLHCGSCTPVRLCRLQCILRRPRRRLRSLLLLFLRDILHAFPQRRQDRLAHRHHRILILLERLHACLEAFHPCIRLTPALSAAARHAQDDHKQKQPSGCRKHPYHIVLAKLHCRFPQLL